MKDRYKLIIFVAVIITILFGAYKMHQAIFNPHADKKEYLYARLEPVEPYTELEIDTIHELKNGWYWISYNVWDDDNATSGYGLFKYHFVRDKFVEFENDRKYLNDTYEMD